MLKDADNEVTLFQVFVISPELTMSLSILQLLMLLFVWKHF